MSSVSTATPSKQTWLFFLKISIATIALVFFIWFVFFDAKKLMTPVGDGFISMASSEPFIYASGPIKVFGKERPYDPFSVLKKTAESQFTHPDYGVLEIDIDFPSDSYEGGVCFENFTFNVDIEKGELSAYTDGDTKLLSDNDVKTCAFAMMELIDEKYYNLINAMKKEEYNSSLWRRVAPDFIIDLLGNASE